MLINRVVVEVLLLWFAVESIISEKLDNFVFEPPFENVDNSGSR